MPSSEAQRLKQQLREAKNELAYSQARSKALFESIGMGVISTDSFGRIETINLAALHMLGIKRNEAVGAWFPKLIQASDLSCQKIPMIDRPVNRAIVEGKSITQTLLYTKSDGSQFPAEVTVSPIIFLNQPVGAVEVFRDVSVELQIDTMKDDFISIASHELRTPATIVKQYIGMLMEGYAGVLSNKQQDMLS